GSPAAGSAQGCRAQLPRGTEPGSEATLCAHKERSSPAAAPGTICEASCHEGDTPSDVTLRPSHGTAVAAVAFWVARPCTRPGVGRASCPHCRSHVWKSQVGRSSDFVLRSLHLLQRCGSHGKIPA